MSLSCTELINVVVSMTGKIVVVNFRSLFEGPRKRSRKR